MAIVEFDPLPFRINPGGRDIIGFDGIESVTTRLDGLLYLADRAVTLEWSGTQTIQRVSLDRLGTDKNPLPLEEFQLPFSRIAGAWVLGGWWRPRLELRARHDGDLDGVPSTRGVTLSLRIRLRDRALASEVAAEILARVSNDSHL